MKSIIDKNFEIQVLYKLCLYNLFDLSGNFDKSCYKNEFFCASFFHIIYISKNEI